MQGITFDASRIVPTATENRPVNVAIPVILYLGLRLSFCDSLRLSELGREEGEARGDITLRACQIFKGCQVETTALLPMSSP